VRGWRTDVVIPSKLNKSVFEPELKVRLDSSHPYHQSFPTNNELALPGRPGEPLKMEKRAAAIHFVSELFACVSDSRKCITRGLEQASILGPLLCVPSRRRGIHVGIISRVGTDHTRDRPLPPIRFLSGPRGQFAIFQTHTTHT
jgi:hypothetical protein